MRHFLSVKVAIFTIMGLIGAFSCLPSNAAAQNATVLVFWLHLEQDRDWQERRSYTGLTLKQLYPALRGITVGLLENKVKLRAKQASIDFVEITTEDVEDSIGKITALVPDGAAVLLDLPDTEMRAVIAGLAGREIALLNIRSTAMALREANCQRNLFHVIPSRRMYTDSIAQFLAVRNWRRVLLLVGTHENDLSQARAYEASFEKFQIKLADRRPFSLSNNPRDRDMNNLKLLTGDAKYDVIVIADEIGEYSRYVPYNTFLPRPVIGGSGLAARAWHWSWERYGAPQLNQRFDRRAKNLISDNKNRHMNDVDWAAWAAVKLIATSLPAASPDRRVNLLKALRNPGLAVDIYKGSRGSIRGWNHQLRQPILIATQDAVIGKLPDMKFLHPYHYEDTLGIDAPQSVCRFD
ncbi:MAG: hypothetical protein ACKVLN_05495 [Rhodobacterales bacterium]|jgi:ABC transporter substrate binding protein (PQQ-dependent alcohol dehydrogenase system)